MDKDVSAKHKVIKIQCQINSYNELPEDTLGQRLTKLRKIMNLSIKELAHSSGISPQTLSNIENGKTEPYISSLKGICKVLKTDTQYLLQLDNLSEDSIGEIIKKYRLMTCLTQEQLARLCSLNKSTIKDYENGRIKCQDNASLRKIYKSIGYQDNSK
nr:helix-turn-helix transcriptional regulator [Geosporobacter ferrireducens]